MKTESFIQTYKLNSKICDNMVKYFWDNKKRHVDIATRYKKSTDLYLNLMGDAETIPCVKDYQNHLGACLADYTEKYGMILELCPIGVTEDFNLQYYKKGEGFKTEHCERPGMLNQTIKRVLVFMTYLNTVPSGGTKFKYYNHTESAVKGKTIIWPSDWTHTHASQVTKKHEKIIATGWISHIW